MWANHAIREGSTQVTQVQYRRRRLLRRTNVQVLKTTSPQLAIGLSRQECAHMIQSDYYIRVNGEQALASSKKKKHKKTTSHDLTSDHFFGGVQHTVRDDTMDFYKSQRVYFRPTPVELLKEAEVRARPRPTFRGSRGTILDHRHGAVCFFFFFFPVATLVTTTSNPPQKPNLLG